MNNKICLWIMIVSLPMILEAQQITGKTSAGSFGSPPVALSIEVAFIDPSGNNILDAGETGRITLTVSNSGKVDAQNVIAKFSTSIQQPKLVFPPSISLGTIAAGTSSTKEVSITASETISNQVLDIAIEVTATDLIALLQKNLTMITKEKVITESIAPDIEILEPVRITTRGIKVVDQKGDYQTEKSSVVVKGVVTDASGVKLISINGKEIQFSLTAKGAEFSHIASLQIGTNPIEIKALDNYGNQRGMVLEVVREEALLVGQYYGLIIAIQDYQSSEMNDLEYPIQDAQKLIKTLTTSYKFEPNNITFLKNPKRTDIIEAFDQLAKKLTENDNLLIFYGGHGYWDEKLKQGYWLPANASQATRTEWISNGTVRDYIGGVSTKHTLLVSDACFSGGIFKTREAFTAAPPAIQMLYKRPSRKAMTSGTMKESVPDKSVFVEYLIKRLQENKESMLTAEVLFSSFKQAVINNSPIKQIPQFGEIRETGDEGGDFIFMRREVK
ncbi:MAG: caspase family protein [bacterium]